MTQALMTAELLANYMCRGLSHVNDWLWDFERQRNRGLRDYARLTHAVVWLAGHPGVGERLISALRFAPGTLSHLIAVAGGMRPLFSPTQNQRRTSVPRFSN